MSLGSIPWTAMVQYSHWYGLEPDVAEAFVDIMREMDQTYVKYYNDEQKKKTELNKPKGNKR